MAMALKGRARPWRGVNLGGWLLLEPGPSAPLNTGRCEWDLMETLRRRQAVDILHRHRETFIQKEDFVAIKNMGLNAVRVPFGYWIVLGPSHGDPYEGPALEYLDRAVQWAEECDLEVLLDLHGCPGGESPDAPCGRVFRGWDWTCWRRIETLQALEVVARRYCDRSHVKGLAVCNEPSRFIPADVLAGFYDQAVSVIRASGMSADRVTVVLPVFQRSVPEFVKTWERVSGGRHENFCFDVHYYHCFEDEWNRMTLAEHLRAVEDHAEELRRFPMVVGEWSLALGGRGKAALPASQAMALFARQQIKAYAEASHGWLFWNWRDGAGVAWDYRMCFQQQLMAGDALSLPPWDRRGKDPLLTLLEPKSERTVRYGDAVCLRAFTGRCVDVEGTKVSARWYDRGDWQTFVLCPSAASLRDGVVGLGSLVHEGDAVRLLAHTGACLAVSQNGKVTGRHHRLNSAELVVRLKRNQRRPLLHSDEIYLQCRSSGRFLDVEGAKVAARFQHFGDLQTFVVEKCTNEGLDWLKLDEALGAAEAPALRGVKRSAEDAELDAKLERLEGV